MLNACRIFHSPFAPRTFQFILPIRRIFRSEDFVKTKTNEKWVSLRHALRFGNEYTEKDNLLFLNPFLNWVKRTELLSAFNLLNKFSLRGISHSIARSDAVVDFHSKMLEALLYDEVVWVYEKENRHCREKKSRIFKCLHFHDESFYFIFLFHFEYVRCTWYFIFISEVGFYSFFVAKLSG